MHYRFGEKLDDLTREPKPAFNYTHKLWLRLIYRLGLKASKNHCIHITKLD